ncbi:MAG: hypothetical protein M9909_03370 [Thermomicrobiales bacterium]|nr:hypothetical protein [Thermomicrobiales bacterium]
MTMSLVDGLMHDIDLRILGCESKVSTTPSSSTLIPLDGQHIVPTTTTICSAKDR